MVKKLFKIHGRVQGVFFRASTVERALELNVTGYARNLPDGTVEVLACGSAENVDALEAWLQRGPQYAQVSRVDASDYDGDAPPRFTTA